jgi:hypothetical protein
VRSARDVNQLGFADIFNMECDVNRRIERFDARDVKGTAEKR